MGMEGISKSHRGAIRRRQARKGVPVSRLCAEIDGQVQDFLARPIEGDWPYLWLDATYVKVLLPFTGYVNSTYFLKDSLWAERVS
mgnify:CR=1 FL=1